ncbi:hypothetical protein RRG08_014254 [Elysia crispata]|uniref:C-type lectin domain-containing protein n=1 Tax=Elysia crispata TaxID=231223 RepID=A0AAE1B6M8_9GAST|nr:hypothetical protein RRG08_014254 [Elysia crispata]
MDVFNFITFCCLLYITSWSEVLAQTACRAGWQSYQGYCYGLAREKLSWSEAQNICSAYGGSLAEIHSTPESDFVKTLLNNASSYQRYDIVSDKLARRLPILRYLRLPAL